MARAWTGGRRTSGNGGRARSSADRIWPLAAASILAMATMSPGRPAETLRIVEPLTMNSPPARLRAPSGRVSQAPSASSPPNTRP